MTLDHQMPGIGLIGCGDISKSHLGAYKRLGLPVRALCNRTLSKARERAVEFFPDAHICSDHHELLALPEVEVVDITTHPPERIGLVADALRAGKHVLSQKPFVLDLQEGERLIALAKEHEVLLAVNQNGRWAPHLAGIRESVHAGQVGSLESVDVSIDWDHSWTVGTAFDHTPNLVLFDFGMHWFDFVACLLDGREVSEVTATTGRTPDQASPQPMLAEVTMTGPDLHMHLRFNGDCASDPLDRTVVTGSEGTLVSEGPDLKTQRLILQRGDVRSELPLQGDWFTTGFEGTMIELLRAIREGDTPSHSAGNNLRSLELAFAACASAESGSPVHPGDIRAI
ncbi:MAG: Gfo/Idh/MocA family oxidoreductase [Planctomycetota bacterium]|nr:Gfo/Idh/MocA family oxidoreductase [Planctomycetota bacterium]